MYRISRELVPSNNSIQCKYAIFITDENNNKIPYGFDNQIQAFDYIKIHLDKDAKYQEYLDNPQIYAKEMYNELDPDVQLRIAKTILNEYRAVCMNVYFFKR